MPGVGMWPPRRYTASMAQREQDSLAQIGDAKYVGERFKKLHGSFDSRRARLCTRRADGR
jgi:hypothetical protein